MKGKKKNRKKVGKVILLCMSFLLTIILTFSFTLAWFYDADWASNYVNMAGAVGIEIRRQEGKKDMYGNDLPVQSSGAGNLHFNISTEKAYPGQAIDVSASVYNNGGSSGMTTGSQAYIRAHFAVYTNVAIKPDPTNTTKYPLGASDPQYQKDLAIYNNEKNLGADSLYDFMNGLISTQNTNTDQYHWIYFRHQGSMSLTDSGTTGSPIKHYFEGNVTPSKDTTSYDVGYYYLCYDHTNSAFSSIATEGTLYPLTLGGEAVFLWNSTFIIPWNLTNASADKYIFVAVTFQAIQTFIPVIDPATGVISNLANNQLPAIQCTYNNDSVQTVFNSCSFTPIDTEITVGKGPDNTLGTADDVKIDFGDPANGYDKTSLPTTHRST